MLDISALKGMTQEEQLKKAAEYANVPVGVLSGIWKQESNQCQHSTMIRPATKPSIIPISVPTRRYASSNAVLY